MNTKCAGEVETMLGVEDCEEQAVASRVVSGLVTNLCKSCARHHDHRDHRLDTPAARPVNA